MVMQRPRGFKIWPFVLSMIIVLAFLAYRSSRDRIVLMQPGFDSASIVDRVQKVVDTKGIITVTLRSGTTYEFSPRWNASQAQHEMGLTIQNGDSIIKYRFDTVVYVVRKDSVFRWLLDRVY